MPSLSTRESLHLLAEDEMLADVPFLFVSDRDLHAFEIHNVLKVGARATGHRWLPTSVSGDLLRRYIRYVSSKTGP